MTLRSSLVIFLVGTALAWGAWAVVVFSVDPRVSGVPGELFFFGALFLALTGTLTILGLLGRIRASRTLPSSHVGPAFRQGMFITVAAVGALLLQRFQILRWWNILLLGGILLFLDLVMTNRHARRHEHP